MSARRLGIPAGGPPALCCAALLALGALGATPTPAAAAGTPLLRTGELAGPVDVRGGSAMGTLARLALGRGSWTVFAKGVLRNTTRDATAHPARCRLSFGGSGDLVLASPMPRQRGDSRQAFLLTHAAHLDAPDTASLRCGAPGSASGDVVAEDIRMVAFRTAALGIAREGASEIFYGNADAASQARLLIGFDALVPGTIHTVARLTLPAGRWAITAKASLRHSSYRLGSVRCGIELGTGSGYAVGVVSEEDQPGDHIPIAVQAVHSAGSPFEVRLDCQDLSDGGTTAVRDVRLAAYRVTALASKELDPGATYGPHPASTKPVVYAGHEVDYRTVPANVGYRTINTMTLPGAGWVVVATGVILAAVLHRPDVSCRVGRAGDYDKVDLRVGPEDTVGETQPFTIAWSGSFDDRRTVRFQCRSNDDGVAMYYLSVLAYEAGTLRTMPLEQDGT